MAARDWMIRYPTLSRVVLATLYRAALQLTAFAVTTAMSFAVQAQIHTSPNDGPELGVR
jgi:hypothetical protein